MSTAQHSRLLDVAPVAQSARDSRRISRLPPGVAMVDPFGFNVAADASPYDLALSASQAPANASLSTSAPVPYRSSYSGVPSVSTAPIASSSTGYRASFMGPPSSTADSGPAPITPTWAKQRASSHGELGNNAFGQPRSQIRNSLLSANSAMRATSPKPGAGPSKLSGEVDLEVRPGRGSAGRRFPTDRIRIWTDAAGHRFETTVTRPADSVRRRLSQLSTLPAHAQSAESSRKGARQGSCKGQNVSLRFRRAGKQVDVVPVFDARRPWPSQTKWREPSSGKRDERCGRVGRVLNTEERAQELRLVSLLQ